MVFTRIEELTISDVVAELPAPKPLGQAWRSSTALDLLVVTLGFEDRCWAVAQELATQRCAVRRVLVCTYATNPDDNELSRVRLDYWIDRLGASRTELECDVASFSHLLAQTLDACRPERDGLSRIGVDISVASTQLVLKLMHAALSRVIDLSVFYSEALTYFPTQREFETNRSRWTGPDATAALEEGLLDVRPLAEYPGNHSSHLAHTIIVIPGFSRDRVRGVISAVDQEFISDVDKAPVHWLVSAPPAPHNAWRRDAQVLIHEIGETQSQADLDTFDYRDTLVALEVPYAKQAAERNFTLCPLGSKMQALGSSLFCVARPDVRVMVAQPQRYRAGHYTEGVRERYFVPLGSTRALRARLADVGTIRLA